MIISKVLHLDADIIADHRSAIVGRNDDGNQWGGHVKNIISNLLITAGGCAARRLATDSKLTIGMAI